MKWPITINASELVLRPLRLRDRAQWDSVRLENRDWLSPWEATVPHTPDSEGVLPTFRQMIKSLNHEAREGRSYSFGIFLDKTLIGQISMGGVMYGALRGAHIGYWIDRRYSNRGYTTAAVRALTDFGFNTLYLHRIEINIRPENQPSVRVAEKAGYYYESERRAFLHIDGHWRDHVTYVRINDALH